MRSEFFSLAVSALMLTGSLTAQAGGDYVIQSQSLQQFPSATSTDKANSAPYLLLSQTRYDPYKNFKFRVIGDGHSGDAEIVEDLFGDG